MKPIPFCLFLACILLLSAACKKNEDRSPTGKMLQAARWQITGSEIVRYMGTDTSIDFYSHWRPCEQDDFLEFAAKGKGSHNENTDKCPEDNQVDNFTWELLENDTKLEIMLIGGSAILVNGQNRSTSEILEINETRLRLKTETIIDSSPGTVVETYMNIP